MQLVPDPVETLRSRFRIVKRLELFRHRVFCPITGCLWSCPVADMDDAEDVLDGHVLAVHEPSNEAA